MQFADGALADRQVLMPPGGADARTAHVGKLTLMAHNLLVSEEFQRAVEQTAAEAALGTPEAAASRVLQRELKIKTKLPAELVKRKSQVSSDAYEAWKRAKAASDFKALAPYLQELFDIARETAERLGYLRFPREARASSPDLPARDLVIMTTGTQGEPSSALSRIAIGEHKQVSVEKGDIVVISARAIPGNERAVSHVIDNLYRRGAEVVHHEQADIHVSGHACQEELRLMINLTRPKFFIPMHGTLRHLIHHARLAEQAGVPHGAVITNGQVAQIEGSSIRVLDQRVPQRFRPRRALQGAPHRCWRQDVRGHR